MTTVLLVVAGQSRWHSEKRIQGDLSIPLDDLGIVAMARRASALKGARLALIAVSESEDAVQSAAILRKACGGRIRRYPELNEPNLGVWQGMTLEEVRRREPRPFLRWSRDPASVQPAGGESVEQCFARLLPRVKRILRRCHNKCVSFVTGRIVNAVLRCYLRDLDASRLADYVREPADCETIELR